MTTTHFIKIPGTHKAIEAALALIRASGKEQNQNAAAIAQVAQGKEIYIWGGNADYPQGGWNQIDGSIRPTLSDTLTDLSYMFKDQATEALLESTGSGSVPGERYRVRITKEATTVGCQTFRNKDILYIADLVRKRT